MRTIVLALLIALPAAAALAQLGPNAETKAAIASLNPLDNDLRGLEVAVVLKEEFRVRPGGAQFVLSATLADGSHPFDGRFVLVPAEPVKSERLQQAERPGSSVSMFRLAEADKPRMAAADALLKELKKTKDTTGKRSLSYFFPTQTCLVPGAPPDSTFSLEIFVRSRPDVDFSLFPGNVLLERANAPPALESFWESCDERLS